MATDNGEMVLVVEDNPADAYLIGEALAQEQLATGLKIIRDGEKAVEFFDLVDADPSVPCPAVVLLDLNLPKVSGEEVLKRIRLSPRCAQTKVLIVSSSNAPSDRELAISFGATDYFRKPSSLDQFMELGPKVRELLNG